MTFNQKLDVLRGCLAGAMKNHAQYQEIPKYRNYWKTILRGVPVDLSPRIDFR